MQTELDVIGNTNWRIFAPVESLVVPKNSDLPVQQLDSFHSKWWCLDDKGVQSALWTTQSMFTLGAEDIALDFAIHCRPLDATLS
jgi:hypothetical protein